MRHVLTLLLILTFGAIIGLGLTSISVTRVPALGEILIGSWSAWPRSGTEHADPYARARIARTSVLPLALGDGFAFVTSRDDNGRALDGRCIITIAGQTPQARFWTLSLADESGNLIPNAASRHVFTSAEVVRDATGAFTVVAAPSAHDGHWLPTAAVHAVRLTLRFYDSPLGVGTRAGPDVPMPSVRQEACP